MNPRFSKFIIFPIVLFISCGIPDKNKMLGNDIRLFQGTKSWALAKAVENDDTTLIHKLIRIDKIPVDARETRFGETLLIWSVYTNHPKSVKALLEEGADPNLLETYSRKSALMYASDYGPDYYKGTEILKLCLKYRGNPNAVADGKTPEGYKIRETPLIIASVCCLAKVKVLISAGADVNYINEKNESALLAAAELGGNEKVETTRYLLFEQHADFRKAFVITIDKDTISFAGLLRDWVYPLNSKKYQTKMEIVKYLKTQGQDYWKTPIPSYFYKNYSKAYLAKY